MAQQYENKNTGFNKGLYTDGEEYLQPENTYRFALNIIDNDYLSNDTFISNEFSNSISKILDDNVIVLGSKYIGDNTVVLFLYNTNNNTSGIYTLIETDRETYFSEDLLRTIIPFCSELNLNLYHPVRIEYRKIRGCEKVIYFTDYYNKPRTLNLNRIETYFDETNTLLNEKLTLISDYEIPDLDLKVLNTTGDLYAGSYNVSIQYLNEDLNNTNWITTTNTVNVYKSKSLIDFSKITGSFTKNKRDENFDLLFGEAKCGKSIEVKINHKDFNKNNFVYFRLAFIIARNNTGLVTEVLVSNYYPINKNNIVFTGNEEGYTKTTKEEILVGKPDVSKIEHIKQFDNRLILAKGKGKEIDWCEFQTFASNIKAEYNIKQVPAYKTRVHESTKSNTTIQMGFMGGEVYAFGIVYIFKDGTESPVYHIPGRPEYVPNDGSKYLDFYEVVSNTYDNRPCISNNYWGSDFYNNALTGKKIRHHKFPDRNQIPLSNYSDTGGGQTIIRRTLTLNLTPNQTPSLPLLLQTSADNYNTKKLSINMYNSNTIIFVVAYFYNGDTEGVHEDYFLKDSEENNVSVDSSTYSNTMSNIVTNGTSLNLIGITFSNIVYPSTDILGHYIVVGERDLQNRTIIDKGFGNILNSGSSLSENSEYFTHTYFNNSQVSLNKHPTIFYLKSPKILYEQTDLSPTEIKIEGVYRNHLRVYDSVEQQDAFPGSSSTGYFGGLISGDNDGQTLLLGFRDTHYTYLPGSDIPYIQNGNETIQILDSVYLRQGEKAYNFYEGKTLVNTEIDSQVAIYRGNLNFPYELGVNISEDDLVYVAIKSGIVDIHPYLENITYYHTHDKLQNSNTTTIYDGDIYINNFPQIHSTYYKSNIPRRLGETISNIIAMTVLTGIGIAATILTAGAGTPEIVMALVILSELLVGTVGVSMEVVSEIIQDLDNGALKDYVKDQAFENNLTLTKKVEDDTLVYVSELVENVFIESDINVDLRLKVQQPVASVYNGFGPAGYKNYLKNKFLAVDETRVSDTNSSTQTLKMVPDTEMYKINKDYSRKNKEKIFFPIPLTYNCKSKCLEKWENRILWSQRSFSEDRADSYKIFLPNNYKDLIGNYGNITGLETLNNKLYVFTERMLYVIPPNYQERLNKDFVTFIGTGEFLSIDPQKMIDDTIGVTGTTLTDSIYKFQNTIIFIDNRINKIYMISSDGLKCISDIGMSKWFKENLKFKTIEQYKSFSPEYKFSAQGVKWIKSGNGISIIADEKFNRLIITKTDLPLSKEGFALRDLMWDSDNNMWITPGGPVSDDMYINNSWTMSFSFNTMNWKSFHSYLPYTYIRTNNYFSSVVNNEIWRHINNKNSYCSFYGKTYQSIIDIIIPKNILLNYINDYIFVKTISNKYDINNNKEYEIKDDFFDSVIFYNNRQCSGLQNLNLKVPENNWLQNQIDNTQNNILVDKFEGKFNINNIRDYVINSEESIFLTNIEQLQNNYFIDKILNQTILDNNKVWTEIENFKGNYLGIRLFYDNTNNYRFKIYIIDIITNYSNT